MIKRILITTADERTWPKDKKEPVLFLGEWCKRHSRKHIWENMDYEVAQYHWSNRKKLFSDYQFLDLLYEEILIDFSEKLNQIHNTKHNLRYWRILIGPWLGTFLNILYDRWFMLKYVIGLYNLSTCYILEQSEYLYVPNDIDQFNKFAIEDQFNEAIYSQLLKFCFRHNISLEAINPGILQKPINTDLNIQKGKGIKFYIRDALKNLLPIYNNFYKRDDDIFFIASRFKLSKDILLQLKLGQFPKIWKKNKVPKVDLKVEMRQWYFLDLDKENQQFGEVARQFVSRYIPIDYLEGYKSLVQYSLSLPWPSKPKMIFTSNAFSSDDVFKCWAAEKTENKAPLLIGQHGGGYGLNIFSFFHEHEFKISDKWLSWGWSDLKRPQIVPIGKMNDSGSHVKYDPKGNALMIETASPRYSTSLENRIIADQWLQYFQQQQNFLLALPERLRRSILLRLNPQDYGWDQHERWRDSGLDIQFDTGEKKIKALIRKSRLNIATYNATSFLEVLSWNMPTICFWSETHFEINDEAKLYFDKLRKVGIFHNNPESAARQMTQVWDDIDKWWKSETVQSAREEFCGKYVRSPDKNKSTTIFKDYCRK